MKGVGWISGQSMDVHMTWNTILLVICVCKYLCFETKFSQEIFSSLED